MGLDTDLRAVSVGRWDDTARAWVGGDRALNTDHPDWRKLRNAYIETRADEAREALPLRDGMRPLLWHVAVPTPGQWSIISDLRDPAKRAMAAVCYCVTAVTLRDGSVRKATRKGEMADDDWLKTLQGSGGGNLLLELGEVVYLRGLRGTDEGSDPLAL